MRRTSTIDILVDIATSRITLRGSARDLATGPDHRARTIATARSEVVIDAQTRTVVAMSVPNDPDRRAQSLVGGPAGSGFRAAFHRELGELAEDGSLLGLLMDDVPVTMVIAGSLLRRRPSTAGLARRFAPPLDVCAGWERGGQLARATLATGQPPLAEGPVAPAIGADPDRLAWHPVAALPAWSMRRARRLDVRAAAAGGFEIDSFFRDSRTDDSVERGVHEYSIRARLGDDGTVLDIAAAPHVLPAPECPAAAASARRLIGMSLRQSREHISSAFTGTSTCTHLNDALRALCDLDAVISLQASDDGWMPQ